jgi:hypothetical protein
MGVLALVVTGWNGKFLLSRLCLLVFRVTPAAATGLLRLMHRVFGRDRGLRHVQSPYVYDVHFNQVEISSHVGAV